jgi:CHAT domain-containing protein/ATP/maltotriose-dependent transcriptional regulator MalT
LFSPIAIAAAQTAPTAHQNYVPPELQVADPNVKAYLDSAEKSAKLGNDGESLTSLQKALELATKEKFLADRGIVEDKLAVYYFTQGKLEDAKSQWVNSLSDGMAVSNLVLQADVLVALATLQQTSGHLDQAMKTVSQALDLSRKSKSLYLESRVLGELSRLQLVAGKKADARVSIEEALQIDRINGYSWEAGHLLYMAWVSAAESRIDKAIEFAASARDLAIKNENYVTFVQASESLAQMYVQTGRTDEGIHSLELARNGVSEQGKSLFQSPNGYSQAASRPFLKITFLEALAMAYEAAKRPDDALKNWQDLYDTATTASVTLARAESARHLADLYKVKKEFAKSIDYYALAADASASAGNEQSRTEALVSEGTLLFQQGEKEKALKIDEDILPLARTSKNVWLQFMANLAIAELLDGTGRTGRVERALKDAEVLVASNVTVPGVGPNYLVELYLRLAKFQENRKDVQQELIALEKALTPALALANAPKETNDNKPLGGLVQLLETRIPEYHVRDAGEKAYISGNFGDALVYFEILQYFEEFDAGWKGKYEDYTKNTNNDPTSARLLPIPQKLISQDGGADILAKNIEDMGPIADKVRPLSLFLFTTYYTIHRHPEMVIKFAKQVLPSPQPSEIEITNEYLVSTSCQLAYALMLEKDLKAAVKSIGNCVTGAKKLGIPELLQVAHQTNVWVLDAAGKHDEAQESIDFLLKQKPDNPQYYAQLAQIKAEQGDRAEACDAWRKAIQLYEDHKELSSAADARLVLADLLRYGSTANPLEQRVHLEAADALYRQLGSSEGQIKAEALLATYYAAQKNAAKAHQYCEAALKIAREAKKRNFEADVLGQVGYAYESSDDLTQALESYRESADIYEQLNDPGNEALQLKNVANVLNALHKPEEALETILRAKAVADTSNSWFSRYWVRRVLGEMYGQGGQFQSSLATLQEAKEISDTANQPLASAWAALTLASVLTTVGSWQEALEQVNSAIPVLQQFKDTDNEYLAYTELSAIYGERESELKDLDKALELNQLAYKLVVKTHPERAAGLNLGVAEIYWQMGRFKDAILKANEALNYFKQLKDETDEAGALMGRAEAQTSDGDLQGAEKSLQMAQPLVVRTKSFYNTGRFYYCEAGLYRAQGRLKESIDQYELVINLLEQFKSSSNVENRRKVSEQYDFIYDELVETYYELSQTDQRGTRSSANKALEYAELNKARAFANSWGHAFADVLKRQVPVALQDRETNITNERDALQSELQQAMTGTGHRSVSQIKEALAKLGTAEAELGNDLRRTSPAYAGVRYPQVMNIDQIPLHLGELLVQFKVFPQSTLVWLLAGTKEGTTLIAFYKVARSREWFADRVFRIRDAFNGGHPEQFDSRITDELLEALFPESVFQSVKSATAIIFVPDDIFFLLPFEMLSTHGQYPLLGTPTEYFPSSAVLRLARTSIRSAGDWQESFIGIADPITSSDDPRYQAVSLLSDPVPQTGPGQASNSASLDRIVSRGFSLERLPGTANEVHGIAGLFASTPSETEIRTGMEATKQELRRTDLARYKFIHFATHGILPVESGIKEPALVLSYDGKGKDDMLLTLSEILEFKLRADMVTLSACNTGSGKVTRAEGVASLGIAFLAAGASSVTVSLWQVADNSTAELMEEFYRNLVSGKSKAAALAAARVLLVSKGYDNPFFWAPFVLTGE